MSPLDRERLRRALGMEQIFPPHEWRDGWCIHCRGDRTDDNFRTSCFGQRRAAPPIDTDPAWTLRAMEAAAVLLRARRESLDWTIEHYPDGWMIIPCHWEPRPGSSGGSDEADWTDGIDEATVVLAPFPEAVCAALLAALDAGALGGEE